MRIHVFSDVHFEHMDKAGGEAFLKGVEALKLRDPADVLVLAGDICQVGRHEKFWKARMVELCALYKKVIYVAGNHEYYGASFHHVDSFMATVDGNPDFYNLVQLSYGPYEIVDAATGKEYRFIGDTMWFPDVGTDEETKSWMADFSCIGTGGSPFEPTVYERHREFLTKRMANLRHGDIVVTHHMPLPACIAPQFEGSPLNPFFVADMSMYLEAGALPSLWVHGHTHVPVDIEHVVGVQKMRVYCNPYGYPREGANEAFWARVGIDI